jgi:TonB family protein
MALFLAGPLLAVQDQSAVFKTVEWEMSLKVFEGMRESLPAASSIVTSSFLKYAFSANFRSESSEDQEQNRIKKIFNLKDVNLLIEGELSWKAGEPEKVPFVFRLDGEEYTIQVRGGDFIAESQMGVGQSFDVEVSEQTSMEKTSLLDTDYNPSSQGDITVFGFEDAQGKPYFISLQLTRMFADVPDGSYIGIVNGTPLRGAGPKVPGSHITPPRPIKLVNPVYPETAIKSGIVGVVIVEVTTDIRGQIVAVRVLKSVPRLDQAAIDAVKQWVYEPMVINGNPKPATFSMTIQFTLAKDKDGKIRGITGVEDEFMRRTAVGSIEPSMLGGVQSRVEGGTVRPAPNPPIEPFVKEQSQEQKEFEKGAVRAVGNIKLPQLIKLVDPVYPEKARQAQVEGTVILEVRADERGNIEDARILRSIPVLDQAAIDAVKQWKYEPLIINGTPRKVVFTVTVRFMLTSGDKEKDFDKFAQGAVKAEGSIKPPRLLKKVDPLYPEDARKAGVQGTVILAAKTDASGKVQDVMILRSIPLLNQAAIDAVKQWVYEPLVINNVPTPVVFTVTVRFQLH